MRRLFGDGASKDARNKETGLAGVESRHTDAVVKTMDEEEGMAGVEQAMDEKKGMVGVEDTLNGAPQRRIQRPRMVLETTSYLIVGATLGGVLGSFLGAMLWGMLGAMLGATGVTVFFYGVGPSLKMLHKIFVGVLWVCGVCLFISLCAVWVMMGWTFCAACVNLILVLILQRMSESSIRSLLDPAGYEIVGVIFTLINREYLYEIISTCWCRGGEESLLDAAAREDAAGVESGDAAAGDGDGGEIQASGCRNPVGAGNDAGEGGSGAAGGDAEAGDGDGGGVQQSMKQTIFV